MVKTVLLILRLQHCFYHYLSHSGKSSRLCLVNVTNPVGSTKAIKGKQVLILKRLYIYSVKYGYNNGYNTSFGIQQKIDLK